MGGCSGSSEISPSVPVLSPQQRLARKEENRKKCIFHTLEVRIAMESNLGLLQEKKALTNS